MFKLVYNEEGTGMTQKTKPIDAGLAKLGVLPGGSFVSLCLPHLRYSFLLTPGELMHAYVLALTRLCCHCLTFVSYTSYKILVTVPATASQGLIGRKSE